MYRSSRTPAHPDPAQRTVRDHPLGEPRALAGGHGAGPDLRAGAEPQQAHAAEAAQQLVAPHLLVREPGLEQRRREQPLHAVVHAHVALTPRDADLAGPEQPVEQRAWDGDLPPPPAQPRATALDEGAPRERALAAEPVEDGRGDVRVPLQETVVDPFAQPPVLPVHPMDGELLDGEDVERLVVGLEELPLCRGAVEPALHPAAAVVADPRGEDQIVVPRAGHLERIELHRAQLARPRASTDSARAGSARGGARKCLRTRKRRACSAVSSRASVGAP